MMTYGRKALFEYTIYPGSHDTKATIGITFKPTPSMSFYELVQLVADLSHVMSDMEQIRRDVV